MRASFSKSLMLGMILTAIGGIFIMLENRFYQYVDENGLLHESLFLPLGVLSIVIGMLFLLFFIAHQIRLRLKK